MIIKEINTKSVITKTDLPVCDYAVNPYVGCTHGCKYLSLIHISEPTRQAEISYAVFCLKKKKPKPENVRRL